MQNVITETQSLPVADLAEIEAAVAAALIQLGVDLDGRWVALRDVRHEHSMSGKAEWVRGGTVSIDYIVKTEVAS